MKALTTVLLMVAAVLAGMLMYRQLWPAPVRGGTALTQPLPVPALALVDDQGRATTLAAGDGRLRLVFFGFVHCPDVCPTTLTALKSAYIALTPRQQAKVQVQLITVDPDRDTPQALRAYLDRFLPQFTGLTGESKSIDEAARALYVTNIKPTASHAGHQGAAPVTTVTTRIHGDEVRVIAPQGQMVRVYNNNEVLNGALAQDLPGLIRQYVR